MSTRDLEHLAGRYFDGLATDEEVAALSDLLRTDGAMREDYLELAAIHARLATGTRIWTEAPAAFPDKAAKHPVRAWVLPASIAAGLALFFWLLPGAEREDDRPAVTLATLLRSELAQWQGSSPAEGSRLNAGPFALTSGEVFLRLDGGTELFLTGPAEGDLETGGRVRLSRGEVRARVPEEAAGFTLAIPGGEILDLGTEFVARVVPSAFTEVTVLAGEIEVRSHAPDAPAPRRLATGETIALDRNGTMRDMAVPRTAPDPAKAMRERRDPATSAERLAFETFDYAAGSHDPAALDGGEGWSGPWSVLTDPLGERLYTGTSRDFTIVADARGKAWLSPVGKNLRQRRLAHPLDLGRDGVRYVSFRWFEEAVPVRNDESKPISGLSLTFRSLDEAVRARIGLRIDHALRPRIETGFGQGYVGRLRYNDGKELRLVAKILSRGEGEDEVSLRVFEADENPGPWEPETWDLVSRGLHFDASLDHLVLLSSGPKPRRIDEIRMGTTWRSVVDDSPILSE